jgi:hypothetical protein
MSINIDHDLTKRNKGDEYGSGSLNDRDGDDKFGDDFEDEEDLDKEENFLGKLILKSRSMLMDQLRRVIKIITVSFRFRI